MYYKATRVSKMLLKYLSYPNVFQCILKEPNVYQMYPKETLFVQMYPNWMQKRIKICIQRCIQESGILAFVNKENIMEIGIQCSNCIHMKRTSFSCLICLYAD